MERLMIGWGLAAAVAVACGGESEGPAQASANGGSAGLASDAGAPASSGGTAESGGAINRTGGQTGAGDSGGNAANTGGRAAPPQAGAGANTGGRTASPEGGRPADTGGTTAEAGSAGEAAEGGSNAGCECGPLERCFDDRLCVARSLALPLGFAIDVTEVTRAQYAAWLTNDFGATRQSPQCDWNDDFAPDPECMARPEVCQGADCGAHPQPCVDFCDAAVYCRSIDKQLCGGLSGGPTAMDGSDSLLRLACSSNDAYDLPYGESIQSGACNDQTANSQATVPVASLETCQSPTPDYAGIYDLVGNLREWEDNCLTADGSMDVCNPRGGTFGISAAAPFCSQTTYAERGAFDPQIGFRCCEP